MATFRKRNGRWQAEVWKDGQRRAKTFTTKAEARAWAAETETNLTTGYARKRVRDLLERYANEVSPTKKGERWERLRLASAARTFLGDVPLTKFDATHASRYRDERLQTVSAATVNREINLLSAAINHARREWKWLPNNPFHEIKRPANPKPRSRRVSDDEIDRICLSLGFEGEVASKSHEVALAFLIALETAMRKGEILSTRPAQVHLSERYVELLDTKNSDPRDVPLTLEAVSLYELIPNGFTVSPASADALFRKAVRRCGIDDLHFHDSRHEALTRLARKLDVLDLARMSGHRDPRQLMIYYNPTASEIASRLD